MPPDNPKKLALLACVASVSMGFFEERDFRSFSCAENGARARQIALAKLPRKRLLRRLSRLRRFAIASVIRNVRLRAWDKLIDSLRGTRHKGRERGALSAGFLSFVHTNPLFGACHKGKPLKRSTKVQFML